MNANLSNVLPRKLTVHTMMGHKHVELASKCLASLVKFSQDSVHVVVHEDGSVTPEDQAAFAEMVPSSSFVLKKDADAPMNEFLSKYPACRKLRDNLVFGLKIFDIQVLENDDNLAYTDCDILFLKPFRGLFEMPPDPKAGGIFMRDPVQAYCLRSIQYLATPKLKLADRLNGGLLYFRRSAFDWDLVEWFLTHNEFNVHPYWKEQTAWSVLAAATNSWMWDEKQVRVVTSGDDFDNDLVVAHFVSNYRHLLEQAPSDAPISNRPVDIASQLGTRCTFLKFFRDELKRKGLGPQKRDLN